jgi:hypothetical protein
MSTHVVDVRRKNEKWLDLLVRFNITKEVLAVRFYKDFDDYLSVYHWPNNIINHFTCAINGDSLLIFGNGYFNKIFV